jgi:Leucine Rich repeat
LVGSSRTTILEPSPLTSSGPRGRALRALVNLTSLNLNGNYIFDEGAQALKDLVNLTSLDLNSDGVHPDGAQALMRAVSAASLRRRLSAHLRISRSCS